MTGKPKEPSSFFRKVARFVAKPATPWGEVEAPPPAVVAPEAAAAKSELKEMIERKRRNDFVRKNEFDMLRKLRREGLSSAQLAALGRDASSDDSDVFDDPVPAEDGVKSKIDAIEAQMRAQPPALAPRAPLDPVSRSFAAAATQPMGLNTQPGAASIDTTLGDFSAPRKASRYALAADAAPSAAASPPGPSEAEAAPDSRSGPVSSQFSGIGNWLSPGNSRGMEVREGRQDPAVDAAVMAFANADRVACRQSLCSLVGPGGEREHEPSTWLVLLDFYRAIGQQSAFGALASVYSDRFGATAPAWRPVPLTSKDEASGVIHWRAPLRLDESDISELSADEVRPTPWVLDWSGLEVLDAAMCTALAALFESWCQRRIDMRWVGGPTLVALLDSAAPTGDPGADRACWLARLAIQRMRQRPGGFDDIAIDYATAYAVPTPPWERAQSRVRFVEASDVGLHKQDTTIGEMTTAFVETTLTSVEGEAPQAHVDLAGELVGDVAALLLQMDAQIGVSKKVKISCRHLVRVDFIAAGDLLNWLIAKKRARIEVRFTETHRLVALFFTSMGIDQYASVRTDNL